ncbi:hypothetical protein [uncultured Methanobrevibacter sp.]|uniref:hypothetical protein n=1 Tax=uncultured Methanobrevibacter sp. TaxID=253161 RepID=UPI0025FAC0E3|nr:hypothetical protein [uncultured Methanobrevibacter sp.]
MDTESVFNSLQKRKNSLKFKLMHSKLKHGTYSFDNSRNDVLTVLNHYKKYGSFFKVSSIVGLTQNEIMNWYIQGLFDNPKFRGFSLVINEINKRNAGKIDDEPVRESETNFNQDDEYIISEYGDGWSYKTYVDGEKVFIISNDLENLKRKVKDRHLPI